MIQIISIIVSILYVLLGISLLIFKDYFSKHVNFRTNLIGIGSIIFVLTLIIQSNLK